MDIVKDVKEMLEQRNPYEKESEIEQLSDVFEYSRDLSQEDVAAGVQLLLAAALQEEDQDMKESFFHAMNNAVVYQRIGSCIDWNMLAGFLPSLAKVHLDYALNMLGLSVQEQYLSVLEVYAHHPDPEIRTWAQEAIDELKYRLAHAPASQKEAVS